MSPPVPVVRYGRYTLVKLMPEAVQRDLMLRISEIGIPLASAAAVGDARRHVLMRSGFRLCDDPQVASRLATLPLPAPHD